MDLRNMDEVGKLIADIQELNGSLNEIISTENLIVATHGNNNMIKTIVHDEYTDVIRTGVIKALKLKIKEIERRLKRL